MTIWSKINPFHPRPTSSLSATEAGMQTARPYSALDHLDSDREEMLRTPVPDPFLASRTINGDSRTSPRKRGTLKALRHHPSLAVLRGRPKRLQETEAVDEAALRAASSLGTSDNDHSRSESRSRSRATERSGDSGTSRLVKGWGTAKVGASPGKRLIRKLSLRRMRSVPQELARVAANGNATPLPDKHATLSGSRSGSQHAQMIKPEIQLTQSHSPVVASTPESGRIRFNVSIELEGAGLSPTRYTSSPRGSYRSQRGHSTPATSPGVQRIMPLSEMHDLSRSRVSLPPQLGVAETGSVPRQHPHPVPLPPRRLNLPFYQPHFASPDDTCGVPSERVSFPTMDVSSTSDFQPVSLSSTAGRAMGLEEEAELFFGGSAHQAEETLRNTSSIGDGGGSPPVPQSFKRLYETADVSASSPPGSDADEPLSSPPRPTQAKIDRRSSSPFEIKIPPSVMKRVSLDAFGKPSPLSQTITSHASWETVPDDEASDKRVREPHTEDNDPVMDNQGIIEFDDSTEQGDQDESQLTAADHWPLSEFHPTQLSTIEEVSSSCGMSTDPSIVAHLRQLTSTTGNVSQSRLTAIATPPNISKRTLPSSVDSLKTNESPFVPPRAAKRSHELMVAPSLTTPNAYGAHEEIERLKEEIAEKQTAWRAESQQRSLAEKVVQEVGARLTVVLDEKAAVLEELNKCRTALDNANSQWQERDELPEQLHQTTRRLRDLRGLYVDLQGQYHKLESELEDLRRIRQNDARTLAASQQRQAELEERLEGAQVKLLDLQARLRQETDEHDQQLNEVVGLHQGRIGALEADLRATRAQHEQATAGRTQLQANMEAQLAALHVNHQEQVRGLEKELLAVDRSRADASDSLMTATYERNELRVEVARLKAKCIDVEAEVKIRQGELEELRMVLEAVRQETKELEDENSDLVERLDERENSDARCEELEAQLLSAQAEIEDAEDARADMEHRLAETREALEANLLALEEKDQALHHLTSRLEAYEDDLACSLRRSQRQADDQARMRQDLEDQLSVAKTQLGLQTIALEAAVTDSEVHKSSAIDLRSRLDTYLAALDRIKLSETTLQAEVTDLRRASVADEMRRVELEKRVKALEADKELLNVALGSKELELTLVQRRMQRTGVAPPANTPIRTAKGGMTGSASASKLGRASTGASPSPAGTTSLSNRLPITGPKESRDMLGSPPSTRMRPPAPPKGGKATTKTALGVSTAHNAGLAPQTPERRKEKEVVLSSSLRKPGQGGLRQQSSLPSLVQH